MGVTIHFEGQLKSDSEFNTVIEIAMNFAQNYKLPFSVFKEDYKRLSRIKDEEDWNYEGPTKGIKIQPDENADPLWLEFDENNYIQEYCKTQFAGIDIHSLIIKLLRKIEPHFASLLVVDEGELWETGNENILKNHFDSCFKMINDLKKERGLDGPYRMKDGRLIDLM